MAAHRDNHRCSWRARAEKLETELTRRDSELAQTRAELDETRAELQETRSQLRQLQEQTSVLAEQFAVLQKKVFGKSSEKQRITPVSADVRKRKPSDPAQKQRKRRETEKRKKQVETVEKQPPVPQEACHCPYCSDGPEDFTEIGRKQCTVFTMVPSRLQRQVHTRVTVACHCGKTIVTAPAPRRFGGKSQFDTSVVGSVIIGKCADSLPVARQAEQLRRQGLPASRATLNRLFLRAGAMLTPLAQLILARIAANEVVLGDETPIRQQDQSNKGYFWTFNDDQLVGYVYSPNRSGETPLRVLGGTKGDLVVDAYSGYNQVTTPEGRTRAGCNAHARRKFCEAKPNAPDAQHAIDLYTEVFLVEHEVEDLGILGTRQHLKLRKQRSAPAMKKLRKWCAEQQPLHLPKGKMGEAISYLLKNWTALTRFLKNPKIPVSNNQSERILRLVAIGRKNYLTVGNTAAGESIAALYTLTACCKVAAIDPHAYFTDVLDRIQQWPTDRLDELLPQNWKPPPDRDGAPPGSAPT